VQFKNRDVIIAYDADEPGQKYARYAAEALGRTAKSIRLVSWPSYMIETPDGEIPAKGGQDLTDFFVRHKKMNKDLQELIDAAPAYAVSSQEPPGKASNDLEKLDGPAQFFERGINDRLSFKPRLLAEKS
jgi:putative DNA primase/helicase